MPSWEDFKPFIVTGLALGGVYALSGVGMVVLYRATGVLNLAFGAVGRDGRVHRVGSCINDHGVPARGRATSCASLFGGVVTLLYGVLFGPPLAARDPLVKAIATLGLALILLGAMSWIWSDKARSHGSCRRRTRASPSARCWSTGRRSSPWLLGIVVTVVTAAFLRYTNLGTAMRALANDREITATLGVPVRRVEAAAWLGSGLLSGAAGLLLSNLVGARRGDADVPRHLLAGRRADRAAALARRDARRRASSSGWSTRSSRRSCRSPQYRDMTPFVLAIVALLFLSRHGCRRHGRRGSR